MSLLEQQTAPFSNDRFNNFREGPFLISPQGKRKLQLFNSDPLAIFNTTVDLTNIMTQNFTSEAFGKNVHLKLTGIGEYSRVYEYTDSSGTIAVKLPAFKPDTPHESYLRHMGQKQDIQSVIGKSLAELGVRVATPLFATDTFYAEEFSDGHIPDYDDFEARSILTQCCDMLGDHFPEMKKEDPELWKQTGIERIPSYERIHTLLVTETGYVWLAPVFTF